MFVVCIPEKKSWCPMKKEEGSVCPIHKQFHCDTDNTRNSHEYDFGGKKQFKAAFTNQNTGVLRFERSIFKGFGKPKRVGPHDKYHLPVKLVYSDDGFRSFVQRNLINYSPRQVLYIYIYVCIRLLIVYQYSFEEVENTS
jgi:hypothetical protein